jgi:phage shock protein PspC (stress-responsive transcriptional regulator)
MPTLVRLLVILAILAALGFGAMYALATLVEPKQGEMTIRVPADKLNPPKTSP